MKKLTFILVAAVAALFSGALYADDYPSRPITFVAVFGPGSASDTICRIIADKLSPVLATDPRRRSPGGGWSTGCSLRPPPGGGRLYAPYGDQLAVVRGPIHTQGLELRSNQGLCADHAGGNFSR